jgi:hypothetical protein
MYMPTLTIMAVSRETARKSSSGYTSGNFGHIEGTHMQHSFKPLVSQDCRYYPNVRNALFAKALSRKWSQDDANDIARVGYKFRKALLEVDPTNDAREVFEAFLAVVITPDVS